jgi:hypothetical protein
MRVRQHKGFGHGLRPNTDQDINCTSCIREHANGVEPTITGEDAYDPRHPFYGDGGSLTETAPKEDKP